MDRLSLQADERKVLGKKVKNLRQEGKLPAHVFGKGIDSEAVTVLAKDFLKTFHQAGETGLLDLKIGNEKVRPVLIRDVQYDPVKGSLIHIDFYQVNLSEKVKVSVPVVQIGDQPEVVHLGEAIVLQTVNEIEVEALPTDLPEKIEIDISSLKQIDDAITVAQLSLDREKITIYADPEEIVIKLAPAVSAEMEKLLEEEAAEKAAVAAEVQAAAEGEPRPEGREEGAPAPAEAAAGVGTPSSETKAPEEGAEAVPAEGKAPAEGEAPVAGERSAVEGEQAQKQEKSQE